jgi:hypothetical protein
LPQNEEEIILSVNYIPDGNRILKLRKQIYLKIYKQGNLYGYSCPEYEWNYMKYGSEEEAKKAFCRNFARRYRENRDIVFDVLEVEVRT